MSLLKCCCSDFTFYLVLVSVLLGKGSGNWITYYVFSFKNLTHSEWWFGVKPGVLGGDGAAVRVGHCGWSAPQHAEWEVGGFSFVQVNSSVWVVRHNRWASWNLGQTGGVLPWACRMKMQNLPICGKGARWVGEPFPVCKCQALRVHNSLLRPPWVKAQAEIPEKLRSWKDAFVQYDSWII